MSNEIEEKQKEAEVAEVKIDEAREGYKPVSYRTSLLFFCIASLANIDPMYQYSLDWFIDLFVRAIADSEPSEELAKRMTNLNEFFQFFLYRNVCRSLFEKDKLVFSLLLSSALLSGYDKLDTAEWRYLLTGGILLDASGIGKVPCDFITEKTWQDINCLSNLPFATGFADKFAEDPEAWRAALDRAEEILSRFCRGVERMTSHDSSESLEVVSAVRLRDPGRGSEMVDHLRATPGIVEASLVLRDRYSEL